MYARVMRAEIDGSRVEELLQVVNDGIVPSAKQQPGFEGMFGLVDRTSGRALLISLWETAADLEASETSGYLQYQVTRAMPFLRGPSYRETFEVVLQAPERVPLI